MIYLKKIKYFKINTINYKIIEILIKKYILITMIKAKYKLEKILYYKIIYHNQKDQVI